MKACLKKLLSKNKSGSIREHFWRETRITFTNVCFYANTFYDFVSYFLKTLSPTNLNPVKKAKQCKFTICSILNN